MKITKQIKNKALRDAQNSLWKLEDLGIMTQTEILKITGILQGLKEFEE